MISVSNWLSPETETITSYGNIQCVLTSFGINTALVRDKKQDFVIFSKVNVYFYMYAILRKT